jgi:hypothetical protein
MPDGFCAFRIADRIIIQFDLPAGCRKHFVARPHPSLLSQEKEKRSQRFGIHPRQDWWMHIKLPDDSKGKNPRRQWGEGDARPTFG